MSGAFHDAARDGLRDAVADYVVVGSGAGGGAAARVLADSGRSVIVLEEGPLVDAKDVSAITHESLSHLFRGGGKTATLGRAPIPYLQGRVVGGTTFVNSAIIWRTPEKVLEKWRQQHGLTDAVDAKALDAAYTQLESDMHVREITPEIANRNDLLMRDGAQRLGIESRFIHRNEKGCRGSSRCFHGCPNAAKQSTAINYLTRAVERDAHVFSNAGATRVVLSGGKATGVESRIGGKGPHSGRTFTVQARRAVVVAASAVQSPNLLRRSGLRHAHLGEHFMSHPGTSVMGLYPDRVDTWSGAAQGYEAYGLRDTLGIKLETINVPPEITASRLPGVGARLGEWLERLDHIGAWAVALRADAEGSVRPSRLFGDSVNYTLTRGDLDRLRRGIKACVEMHFAAGATQVLHGIYGLPEAITSTDQLELFDDAPLEPRAYNLLATHLFGGCRAGSDAATHVVDARLRVHGTENLHVMDASVFPSNTGVNPQHGIMALATVAAKRLAEAN